jgi:hypothetical protein
MRDVTAFNFPDSCCGITLIMKTIAANCAVRISIIEVQIYYFMEVTEPICAGCSVVPTSINLLLRWLHDTRCYGVTVILASYLAHLSFSSRPGDNLSGIIPGVLLILF